MKFKKGDIITGIPIPWTRALVLDDNHECMWLDSSPATRYFKIQVPREWEIITEIFQGEI